MTKHIRLLLAASAMLSSAHQAMADDDVTVRGPYERTVVIEEATGNWCGFCPRGIVAVEAMQKKHPDSFIGIAVHAQNNDPMEMVAPQNEGLTESGKRQFQYAEHAGFLASTASFPTCNVNRHYFLLDVGPDEFERYYDFEHATGSEAEMSLTTQLRRSYLTATATVRFCRDMTDTDYRVIFVLKENGVTGYKQQNYYSGGSFGEMGGFENMPPTVEMDFNDVARLIDPNYNGNSGNIPSDIEGGKEYTVKATIEVPSTISDSNNLVVVAMVTDKTGEIIQAAQVPDGMTLGVESVETDMQSMPEGIFNLNGQRIENPGKGLYIINGKKTVAR